MTGGEQDLKTRIISSMQSLTELCADLDKRHKELDEKEKKRILIEEKMAANAAKFGNKIELNVGMQTLYSSSSIL
jgi:hypothetical protein